MNTITRASRSARIKSSRPMNLKFSTFGTDSQFDDNKLLYWYQITYSIYNNVNAADICSDIRVSSNLISFRVTSLDPYCCY